MSHARAAGSAATAAPFRSRALGRLGRRARGPGPIVLGEMSDALHQLGPLYLLLAVASVAASPLSGIPGLTALSGLSIAGLAVQLLIGRRSVWLPEALRRRVIDVGTFQASLSKADIVAGTLERPLRRRWVWLTRGPVRTVLLCVCLLLGLVMPLMEIVPFGGSILASVVLLITLALIARDGAAALTAALVLGAAIGFGGTALV